MPEPIIVLEAYKMGKNAFLNGMDCIPANDKVFMEMLYGGGRCAIRIGTSGSDENLACMTSWLKGWTYTNLEFLGE